MGVNESPKNNGFRCFAKCCGICCCCVIVVLGVMIPVGILVIAPKLGQSTLDGAQLVISNGTMYNMPSGAGMQKGVVGNIFNDGTMSSSFPFAAEVLPFNVTLWAPDALCALAYPKRDCSNKDEYKPIAQFEFPSLHVKKGINVAKFTADLVVIEPDYVTDFGLAVNFCNSWDTCIPTYDVPQLNVTLKGEPTLKTMGFLKVKNLKLEKDLNCIHLPAPKVAEAAEEPVDEVVAQRRLTTGGLLTIAMECRMVGSDALTTTTTTAASVAV